MSYQQSLNDQRGTYQSSYQRYQGERIQAQLQRVPPRMGSQAQSSQPGPAMPLEIVRNAKSASQQEEWDWRSWKKSKKGKKRRKSKKSSSSSGSDSFSSSSESSSGKKGRKKERKNKKEKKDKKSKKPGKRSRSRSKLPQDDEEKRALRAAYERSQLQLKVFRE